MSTGERKNWRGEQTSPTGKVEKGSRGGKIFSLVFFMMLIAGAVVAFFLLIDPVRNPHVVVIAIQEYRSRLYPPNAFARQDGEAFLGAKEWDAKTASTAQEKDLLQKALAKLKDHAEKETTVIYLNALAASDQGEVFLIPGDARPDGPGESATWMPMRQVLKDIQACPSKRKLLLLDVMKPVADARLGVLANDVAEQLWKDLEDACAKDPHLWILTACAPGQTSLTSEELGRSVFAYHVEEAMRGAAAQPDARTVKLQELVKHVKNKVDQWAVHNRSVRQTPMLLGANDDFDLVLVAVGEDAAVTPQPLSMAYPDWLYVGWRRRDAWLRNDYHRLAPVSFNELNALLLLSEQRWGAGVPEGEVRKDYEDSRDRLEDTVKLMEKHLSAPRPRSLALAAVLRKPPEPPEPPEEKKPAAKPGEKKPENKKPEEKKPEEKPPDVQEDLRDLLRVYKKDKDNVARDGFFKKHKAKPFEVSGAAFELIASDRNPLPDLIVYVDGLLKELNPPPEYVETILLRRLANLARQSDDKTNRWPATAVRLVLEVTRTGERLHAGARETETGEIRPGLDPRAFPWLRDALQNAAELRHRGEAFLFARGFAPIEQATKLLTQADAAYKGVGKDMLTIQNAWNRRDEAMALLPNYVPYLTSVHHREEEPREEADWLRAAQAVQRLQDALSKYAPGSGPKPADWERELDELGRRTEAVRLEVDDLRRRFAGERQLREWIDESARPDMRPNVTTYLRIQAILSTPWLRAEQRREIWTAGRTLARKLHEAPPEGELRLPELDRSRQDALARLELTRARRRARLAIELLKLAGLPEATALQEAFDKLGRGTARETDWQGLGRRIRVAWSEALPRATQAAKNSIVAERLALVHHPLVPAASLSDPANSPTIRLRRGELAAQWRWLAERYMQARNDPSVGDQSFYDDAANDFRRRALTLGAGSFENLPELSIVATDRVAFTSDLRPVATQLRIVAPGYTIHPEQDGYLTATPDAEWLQVEPASGKLPVAAADAVKPGEVSVPLTVGLRPGATSSDTPPPKGFLAQVRLAGRTYHLPFPVAALPEPDNQRLQIVFRNEAKPGPEVSGDLLLRPNPNVTRPLYVFVKNPTGESRSAIVQVLVDNRVVADSDKLDMKPEEERLVELRRRSLAAAADKSDFTSLERALRVRLVDEKMAVLNVERTISISAATPREYVDPPAVEFEPPNEKNENKSTLTVKLALHDALGGGEATARVTVFDPQWKAIFAREGNSTALLPPTGDARTIKLQDFEFPEDFAEQGQVHIEVDGYPRAFLFKANLPRGGSQPIKPSPKVEREIRLRASQIAGKAELRVEVETDNPPSEGVVELLFDRDRSGTFPDRKEFPTPRKQAMSFRVPLEGGPLEFKAESLEWSHTFNVAEMRGEHKLKAVIREKGGRPIESTPVTVFLDDTPPRNARFSRIEGLAVSSGADAVKIRRKPNSNLFAISAMVDEPDSHITEATFFVGDLLPDGKLPKTAVRGKAGEGGAWSAEINLQGANKPGNPPADVIMGVIFVNSSGLATAPKMLTVTLADPEVSKVATIRGTVLRGETPQPNFEVTLFDEKNKQKDQTKTDKEGRFIFKDVAPGNYRIYVKGGLLEGQINVDELKAGEDRDKQTVSMKLK